MRLPLKILRRVFNRSTLWAVVLVLVLIAVWVLSADSAPTWIYQGF
jgi:hypothetical protein